MSRAFAYVRTLLGEHVAHGIYSGSSDMLGPNLSVTADEAWAYEKGNCARPDGLNAWDVVTACEHVLEVGYAYSDYGGGSHWPVRFCRECMVVHGPLCPWSIWEGSDAPESWLGVWPKDGDPPIETTAEDVDRVTRALPIPEPRRLTP